MILANINARFLCARSCINVAMKQLSDSDVSYIKPGNFVVVRII